MLLRPKKMPKRLRSLSNKRKSVKPKRRLIRSLRPRKRSKPCRLATSEI
jgi:hypothetical protein